MIAGRFRARLVGIADLEARCAEWDRLGETALEPNPFYSSASLIAAEKHLHPERPIRLLIVEDDTAKGALVALFPLEKPHLRDAMPFGAVSLYRNPYTALATPLIRAEGAEAILATALARLAESETRLILPFLPDNRDVAALITRHAAANSLRLERIDGRERAMVETTLTADEYRRSLWDKDIRSTYRRRLARLAEHGPVAHQNVHGDVPAGRAALEAFLALEWRGWKGKKRTAFVSHASTAGFARAAYAHATVQFDILRVGNDTISIAITLVSQGAGFSIKATYDEDFARFGAGTLLDGLMVSRATADGPLKRLDSCASLGHPIAERWCEAESVGRYILGLRPDTRLALPERVLRVTGPYGIWRGYDATARR